MATDANDKVQAGSENNEPNEKVTFDEKQQRKVDELLKEAMGRAGKEVRQELAKAQERLASLESELTEARETVKTASTKKEKSEAQDDLEAIRAELAEAKRLAKSLKEEADAHKRALADKEKVIASKDQENMSFRKKTLLHSAAEKVGFVSVDHAIRLTDDCVVWNDERQKFVVVDPETAAERRNSSYDLMSVEDFYHEFAAKNPHMVKADMRGGAGSSEGSKALTTDRDYPLEKLFGKDADSKLVNRLAIERGNDWYRKQRAKAREQGLI